MLKFIKKAHDLSIARTAIALLALTVFLFCGCARKVTAVARVEAEDHSVETVVAKLNEGVEPAALYESVYSQERVVSVILEGFTSEDNMRALADAASQQTLPVVFFLSYVDVSDYPDTAKYIATKGCDIGNYGLNGEKVMQQNTVEQNAKAFYQTQTAILLATERTPTLFRCNGSEYTDEVLRVATASGLKAGVQPSAYLNHRSFSSYGSALNFVRKLSRGSIITIKLGQELDAEEYGDPGEKLDEEPAIDKQPSITNETLFATDDAYSNTLNVFQWLMQALDEEGYQIVAPGALRNYAQKDDVVRTLSEQELALYDPDQYTGLVTSEPLGVTQTDAAPDSYFDGAVFVGDSISIRLESYVSDQRETQPDFFGTARFLTNQGLGVGNALWQVSADSRHPEYNGTAMTVEDAIAAMGDVARVYIMLGMNDIQYYSEEEFIENYHTLTSLIHNKAPDAEICIQSITPGIAARTNTPTNQDIFLYDLALARFCAEYGYPYLDVASALRDSSGYLPDSLCSDAGKLGLHLNDGAAEIWIRYLRTHTF